ncbi:prepilin-type N-terminal cleavage/methylation domain-containing protein [Deinococcus sp. HMF7620]|uniref:Prepilin-type N-terminal cleavage/methylation domain-containing protein n=1 Tax=Deinococcus arboris TaxID=2682977 RepID=A0A7C9I274_9DEIO|nr:prepilin-type N-terminal cleavage/methylation domain-containing protein [Deinococcus arboris]MVN89388.1 prepilin-type N-terminal cleavage/methylation domain-containing protein [Deinococcus arboris]
MANTTQGFTLVEILIVIGILGILLGVLVPSLLSARRSAVEASALTTLRNVINAAETARTDALVFTSATECRAVPNSSTPTYGPGNVIESCQIIQDNDRTYGVVKSSTGSYHVFNGGSMFKRSTSVAPSVTALSAINSSN